jgi:hypothetical protein
MRRKLRELGQEIRNATLLRAASVQILKDLRKVGKGII